MWTEETFLRGIRPPRPISQPGLLVFTSATVYSAYKEIYKYTAQHWPPLLKRQCSSSSSSSSSSEPEEGGAALHCLFSVATPTVHTNRDRYTVDWLTREGSPHLPSPHPATEAHPPTWLIGTWSLRGPPQALATAHWLPGGADHPQSQLIGEGQIYARKPQRSKTTVSEGQNNVIRH